jgi:type I restriction enzyme S subunit
MGSAPKGETYVELNKGIPLIAGAADYGEVFPSPKKATTSPTKLCQKGDLIICVRATIGDLNWADKEYCLGRGVAGLRSKEELLPEYLFYFIKAKEKELYKNATGSTFLQINRAVIEQIEIPLPPLPIQKQIAAVLEKADYFRQKSQQMEQELNSLAQSVFLDMFGDPINNSKGWSTYAFKELGELKRGKSKHRPRNDPKLLGGPYPLIQTGDVARADNYITSFKQTYSEIGLQQSKEWDEGTLCITIAANIADTAILSFKACFPDSVVGFNADESITSNVYIHHWLKQYQRVLQDLAPESAQKNINLKILEQVQIFIPPLELQREFILKIEQIEKLKKENKLKTLEFNENFNSLMQRAFKGELEIKNVA